MERLKQNINKYPERVVLHSEGYPEGITYSQLDEASGRVCKFLKDRNIGKEDFVMILMPREASAYISVIGVWKCGAAMTLLEEDYPTERIEYIKKDLNCKFVITKENFDEMMRCEICDDYDIPQPHDACYAGYTSGSTGNPKGVLHEFGKLDTFDYDYEGKLLPLDGNGRFAVVTPLNFLSSIRNAVVSLLYGKCLYIVPNSVVKNHKELFTYLKEKKIDEISITSSYFRTYPDTFKNMKNVFVHGEPCTGVFLDGINIINIYGLSEIAFPIFTFRIDKLYENAPLGYANKNAVVKIINDDCKETKQYETGEIVVKDVFTRKYIDPQNNNEKFLNGYFRCGDFAYYDENGMAFLRGRKDDMIKINGNRIEPMEIETNVKRVLGINNVLVKGFLDENRAFVSAYLLKEELSEKKLLRDCNSLIFSASEMKNRLQGLLPDYMIPSYYVILDVYPKNENDKISRRDLPKPFINDYINALEFPQNDREEYFCRLFEKVLNRHGVGVKDDFYQIGGDSLSAMMLVSECDRFELTVSDIYNARTVYDLSRIVSERTGEEKLDAENDVALLRPQPLLPEQQATFDGQMEFPEFALHNLIRFFKLSKGINVEKFRMSVDKVLRHHPVFSSILINDSGTEKISYRPELYKNVKIKNVSADQLSELIEEPRKAFQMENQLLYRCLIYKCSDEYYFYLEVHHIITDGVSLKQLIMEIDRCYCDGEITLPTDYLFLVLQKNEEKSKSNRITPNQIRELYETNDFINREDNTIKPDKLIVELIPSRYESVLNIDKNKIKRNKNFKKYNGNVFYLTCFLKTIADFNERNKALAFWVYSGREQRIKENVHGMLIRDIPIGIQLDRFGDMSLIFKFVKDTIDRQIALDTEFISAFTDDFMFTPYFVYHKDVIHSEHLKNVFEKELHMSGGSVAFEFNLIDNEDDDYFRYIVKYAGGIYYRRSIEKFCMLFETIVNSALDET